jgi:hypothetical protein
VRYVSVLEAAEHKAVEEMIGAAVVVAVGR